MAKGQQKEAKNNKKKLSIKEKQEKKRKQTASKLGIPGY